MKTKSALAWTLTVLLGLFIWQSMPLTAQKKVRIPHGQSKPPGPALSPQEAIKKMKVPPGFSVELVASEPNIVNPIGMTFDEKGRVWITESLEYPRSSAGPGKDRIKVLEDTNGDGKADKFTIFAEGLNIPSGIAVGHGGVWVANAPDILFMKDTDGDGKADKKEVVVTGFGRRDTHELPNSLTWGPDGWLYGLNGVFNPCVVKSNNGKTYRFTCALFRIHPKTREFQLFCEGTSNPWGVAWDTEGSAFISACVIDHLWHLAETGYYHRQGGPYPPYTWKLGSIVQHKHQKAAYCGIHFFDSDAYPPEYREKLYMGNIHGNCVNSDELTRKGSSYFARPRPDFLSANDAWFMPVVQKTGPDGCLYVLDWYDRYHCYQDARRDPKGIDRLKGRLYRVRYKNTPRAPRIDLAKENDDQLIKRLHSPNVYFRDIAQRLLCERNRPATNSKLQKLVLDPKAPRKARIHALWALIGTGSLPADFHMQLLNHADASYRAWAVRAAGNFGKVDKAIGSKVVALASDQSPDVQLQVAVAAKKVEGIDSIALLTQVLAACGDDEVIPHIVWQNLHPLLEERGHQFLARFQKVDPKSSANLARLMPRVIDRILGSRKADPAVIVSLFNVLIDGKNANQGAAQKCLTLLGDKIQSGELADDRLKAMRSQLQPIIRKMSSKQDHPLYIDAGLLAATLKDQTGFAIARSVAVSKKRPEAVRLEAIESLVAGGDGKLLASVDAIFADKDNAASFRGKLLGSLSRHNDPQVAVVVLKHYPQMESDMQPKAIELLTQRVPWSKHLLAAIGKKQIPTNALNVNQVRRLLATKDPELIKAVKAKWGTVRTDRNPAREKIVTQMRQFLRKTPADPMRGVAVFKKVCAQCHKIHGQGTDVGPDITSNGRNDFEQLLSNVMDPSLVIGAAYQATTVATKKGQFVTGLLVENSKQRVVLKMQGGKLETIARNDIEDVFVSKLSMMPEDLEKQLKPQEIADLFAYICLDKPPNDPKAKRIPGSPNPRR